MSWILYVLSPVIMHLLISEGIAVLAGTALDSAACTALSSAVVLPAAIRMYRRDGKLHEKGFGSGAERKSRSEREPGAGQRVKGFLGKCAGNRGAEPLFLLGCFAGGGILNLLWSGLMNVLGITRLFSNDTQTALLTSGIVMQLLGPGLLVPIAEELVFRGLCYTRMKMQLPVWQAALFSALLFALTHGNPIQIIYAFPMALILVLLYEKGGMLAGPVLFHMGANLLAILLT
ncbi:MAG: CPBP family intramembrane metalloprotease [Lachnospiraceae bacterium]|nr:CPBP family intramembrane metalloprotease [Lachnospiraceae bacterium]